MDTSNQPTRKVMEARILDLQRGVLKDLVNPKTWADMLVQKHSLAFVGHYELSLQQCYLTICQVQICNDLDAIDYGPSALDEFIAETDRLGIVGIASNWVHIVDMAKGWGIEQVSSMSKDIGELPHDRSPSIEGASRARVPEGAQPDVEPFFRAPLLPAFEADGKSINPQPIPPENLDPQWKSRGEASKTVAALQRSRKHQESPEPLREEMAVTKAVSTERISGQQDGLQKAGPQISGRRKRADRDDSTLTGSGEKRQEEGQSPLRKRAKMQRHVAGNDSAPADENREGQLKIEPSQVNKGKQKAESVGNTVSRPRKKAPVKSKKYIESSDEDRSEDSEIKGSDGSYEEDDDDMRQAVANSMNEKYIKEYVDAASLEEESGVRGNILASRAIGKGEGSKDAKKTSTKFTGLGKPSLYPSLTKSQAAGPAVAPTRPKGQSAPPAAGSQRKKTPVVDAGPAKIPKGYIVAPEPCGTCINRGGPCHASTSQKTKQCHWCKTHKRGCSHAGQLDGATVEWAKAERYALDRLLREIQKVPEWTVPCLEVISSDSADTSEYQRLSIIAADSLNAG